MSQGIWFLFIQITKPTWQKLSNGTSEQKIARNVLGTCNSSKNFFSKKKGFVHMQFCLDKC
jgi:hypothetical protein